MAVIQRADIMSKRDEVARLIGELAGVEEFTALDTDTIVSLAIGLYWSQELNDKITILANEVNLELNSYANSAVK